MPPRTTAITPAVSRDKLFWAIAFLVVAGQLVAFWMLCSSQARKAEVRDVRARVQRLAVADCLRYMPGATLRSCAVGMPPLDRGAAIVVAHQGEPVNTAAPAVAGRALPVGYVYR